MFTIEEIARATGGDSSAVGKVRFPASPPTPVVQKPVSCSSRSGGSVSTGMTSSRRQRHGGKGLSCRSAWVEAMQFPPA